MTRAAWESPSVNGRLEVIEEVLQASTFLMIIILRFAFFFANYLLDDHHIVILFLCKLFKWPDGPALCKEDGKVPKILTKSLKRARTNSPIRQRAGLVQFRQTIFDTLDCSIGPGLEKRTVWSCSFCKGSGPFEKVMMMMLRMIRMVMMTIISERQA